MSISHKLYINKMICTSLSQMNVNIKMYDKTTLLAMLACSGNKKYLENTDVLEEYCNSDNTTLNEEYKDVRNSLLSNTMNHKPDFEYADKFLNALNYEINYLGMNSPYLGHDHIDTMLKVMNKSLVMSAMKELLNNDILTLCSPNFIADKHITLDHLIANAKKQFPRDEYFWDILRQNNAYVRLNARCDSKIYVLCPSSTYDSLLCLLKERYPVNTSDQGDLVTNVYFMQVNTAKYQITIQSMETQNSDYVKMYPNALNRAWFNGEQFNCHPSYLIAMKYKLNLPSYLDRYDVLEYAKDYYDIKQLGLATIIPTFVRYVDTIVQIRTSF